MSKIYLMVLELGPDNMGGNIADVNQFSCMGVDVMLTVTRSMTSCTHDVTRVTSSRAPSHARRHCDIRQIGAGALSMPNFKFLKSDHK